MPSSLFDSAFEAFYTVESIIESHVKVEMSRRAILVPGPRGYRLVYRPVKRFGKALVKNIYMIVCYRGTLKDEEIVEIAKAARSVFVMRLKADLHVAPCSDPVFRQVGDVEGIASLFKRGLGVVKSCVLEDAVRRLSPTLTASRDSLAHIVIVSDWRLGCDVSSLANVLAPVVEALQKSVLEARFRIPVLTLISSYSRLDGSVVDGDADYALALSEAIPRHCRICKRPARGFIKRPWY